MIRGSYESMWFAEDSEREDSLERARDCAALTKPWVLPPKDQEPDAKLPQPYSSLGARGMTNLEGAAVLAIFPTDMPWIVLEPAAEQKFDLRADPDVIQRVQDLLYYQTLILLSKLEAAGVDKSQSYRQQSGFRSRKRMSLSQCFITGDTLERLTDNYRIQVYNRMNYVTKRSCEGDIVHHGIREKIDLLTLTDNQLQRAKLDPDEVKMRPREERWMYMYTFVEWQPRASNWTIKQEVHNEVIVESQEQVSPFFCTPFSLAAGENYGRGFVEQNLGDFTSFDTIREKMLDFAAACSRIHPVLDPSCQIRDDDFNKPSGAVLRARVEGGLIQNAAFLKVDKLNDFNVVYQTGETLRRDLGQSMLLENEVAPSGEAGRSPVAWQTIVGQLDKALGGVYSEIADNQQTPMVRRAMYQLQRDNLILPLPMKSIEIKLLSGLNALSRGQKVVRLNSFVENVRNLLGDQAAAELNMSTIVGLLARMHGIDEPGVVKTPEQKAAEQQAAEAAATRMAVMEKGVDTAGNVIEAQSTAAPAA